MSKISLVLGGVRSGKSQYAEGLLSKVEHSKIYIATAEIFDEEMKNRVDIHRLRRGDGWKTLEVPIEISEQISNFLYADSVILVDCLTLWLSNLMHKELDIIAQIDLLVEALKNTQAEVVLVSSEVGMGIVPENVLARQFCDYAGILHQRVAEVANSVILVVAGIPMIIKDV